MMEWADIENSIAVIALHKCKIERACIYELLKLLSIMHVFVDYTVKLLLDRGGVSDHKRSGRPHVVHMPQVMKTLRSGIN